MPKFCGVYRFDSGEVFKSDLVDCLTNLNNPGVQIIPDCGDKFIGLGLLDRTGENALESHQIRHQPETNLTIVADATLLNRTELISQFGAFAFEAKIPTDSELILKAYQKWGRECPEHLNGDFAFAIWHKGTKTLFCARDHLGASPFFYSQNPSRIVFSSKPAGVAGIKGFDLELNREKLGIFLLKEPHTHLTNDSWYKDIFALPAGSTMTVDSKGIEIRKYWSPGPVERLHYKTEKETLEAFRELLFGSIRARINGSSKTASLLSGGLDSSSVTAVSASILAEQNRELDVFAGVLSDPHDPEYEDERAYIEELESIPNVRINFRSAPAKGPFSNLPEFFEHYDSPFISSRHYLYTDFLNNAEAIGVETLFDGAFGEFGPTSHGDGCFAELFRDFRWIKLWRELRLRSDIYGDSLKYNIRANVINPIIPEPLKSLRRGVARTADTFTLRHPFKDEFAASLLQNIDAKFHTIDPTYADHRKNQIAHLVFLQEKMSDFVSPNFGNSPVEIRYPFLDRKLIEFCLAVPIELKIRDGYYRYLIRAALEGILPAKIQWRVTKTPFSPDYVRRYNSQLPGVRRFLQEIESDDPVCEILDIKRISAWANLNVSNSELNTENERIARELVPQAVYLIHFLRKFSAFRV